VESPWDVQEVIGTIAFFVLLIGLVFSLIWRGAFIRRAHLQYKSDDRYKELAAKTEETQAELVEQLKAIGDRLARIEASNASIEDTLKVVE
jgi:hypothetical protein